VVIYNSKEEWIRNLLINRPDLSKDALERTRSVDTPTQMQNAEPQTPHRFNALDDDDRHVEAVVEVLM